MALTYCWMFPFDIRADLNYSIALMNLRVQSRICSLYSENQDKMHNDIQIKYGSNTDQNTDQDHIELQQISWFVSTLFQFLYTTESQENTIWILGRRIKLDNRKATWSLWEYTCFQLVDNLTLLQTRKCGHTLCRFGDISMLEWNCVLYTYMEDRCNAFNNTIFCVLSTHQVLPLPRLIDVE